MKFEISDKTALAAAGIVFVLLLSYTAWSEKTIDGNVGGNTLVGDTRPTLSDSPIDDGSSALVTLIEYSDFQCPYCARAAGTVQQIRENYAGKVDVIFKHFPLDFHKQAQKAAEASECARDQGRFWDYHDTLFASQRALGVSNLKDYARQLGLDATIFNKCLDSGEKASPVNADSAEGRRLGVQGTPTFYVNDQQVVGAQPYEKFEELIDVFMQVNSQEPVEADSGGSELKEITSQPTPPAGSAGCGGACGNPSCGAATGGACGCGG